MMNLRFFGENHKNLLTFTINALAQQFIRSFSLFRFKSLNFLASLHDLGYNEQ